MTDPRGPGTLASLRDRPIGVHVLALAFAAALRKWAERQTIKETATVEPQLPLFEREEDRG